MKKLYTYVLEFREGTYISQVRAKNIDSSIDKWLKQIAGERKEIEFMTKKTLKTIKKSFKEENNRIPFPLRGLSNVWYLDFNTKKGFGLINVIETAS